MSWLLAPLVQWSSLLASNLGALALLVGVVALLTYTAIRVGARFVVMRLAGLAFVLLGVSFVTFILGYFSPGTAVEGLCGQHCTPEKIKVLQHFYHLDLPWYEQYGTYLNGLLHLDLG